jgi:hypothetical protein
VRGSEEGEGERGREERAGERTFQLTCARNHESGVACLLIKLLHEVRGEGPLRRVQCIVSTVHREYSAW